MTTPVNDYFAGDIIELSLPFTSRVEATVTSGGTDVPGVNTSETLTITTLSNWPVLLSGQSQAVMDLAEVGQPAGQFEVMLVTANTNGTGVSWTVTRGYGGVVTAHAANFTLVPVTLPPAGAGGLPQLASLPVDPATVGLTYSYVNAAGFKVVGTSSPLTWNGSASTPAVGTIWRDSLGAFRTWLDSTGQIGYWTIIVTSTGTGKAVTPHNVSVLDPTLA